MTAGSWTSTIAVGDRLRGAIRDQIKFSSEDELAAAVAQDAVAIRQVLGVGLWQPSLPATLKPTATGRALGRPTTWPTICWPEQSPGDKSQLPVRRSRNG